MTSRAFIHVGAPKTGSTFLQGVLWKNRRALLAAGVRVPGRGQGEHYRAGKDVREIAFNPADPGVDWTGAWDVLAERIRAAEEPTVVVSDEHLAALSSAQAHRVVTSLAPREVHVVYVVREIASLLPSEWQEYVKHRSTLTFDEWVTAVLTDREHGPGNWFWRVHDPVGVLRRWGKAVPASRIHVITLPPPGSPRDELWRRYAGVLGVDPSVVASFDVAANTSLGLPETELLRRLNAQLPDEFASWHHVGLVRDLLGTRVLSPESKPFRAEVPAGLGPLVTAQRDRAAAAVAGSGCDLVGSLDELQPVTSASGTAPPSDAELLEVSIRGIRGLVLEMARRQDQHRAQPSPRRVELAKGRILALKGRNRALDAVIESGRQASRAVRERRSR